MSSKNLIFLHGADPFSIFTQTKNLTQKFQAKHGDHNFEKFWGDDLDSAKSLLSALETIPFLGDHRMLLLRDPWNTRKSKFRSEIADFLKAKRLPDSTIFLISETTKPDKREALFKFLTKNAQTTEFKTPTPQTLQNQVQSQIDSLDAKIAFPNITHLISKTTSNGFRLSNEIPKLALASNGSEITKELIDELVPSADPLSNIFALTDSLGSRNLKTSLKELHALLDSGSHELQILATLSTHFRTLVLISDFMTRNPSQAPNAASALKIHPFVAKKAITQVRNFTFPELRQIFQKFADLDFSLKSSDLNPTQELEKLTLHICQK